MWKKILIGIVATAMLLLTIAFSVNAYPLIYPDLQPVSPNYYYYGGYDGIPTVAGPYPRYYLGYNDYRGSGSSIYLHDDFHHYDDYIGYRDLDVFYPDRGYIDVLRNPQAEYTGDLLDPKWRVYNSSDSYHVYGMLPGGAVYRKHYYHDHAWDLEYDYGVGYPLYGWFEPVVSYINKPVFKKSCFSQSICQYGRCGCN